MNVILEHPAEIEQRDAKGELTGKLIASSECLVATGFDRTGTTPTVRTRVGDRQRVEKLLVGRGERRVCTGSWTRSNPADDKCPQNVFMLEPNDTHDGRQSKLALRCQHAVDHAKIDCPHDQRRTYTLHWTGEDSLAVEFTPTAAELKADPIKDEMARLMAMPQPDLRVEAARKHVKWDAEASVNTMVRLIAEASMGAAVEPETEPAGVTVEH